MKFTKLHGSGNDYVLVDGRGQNLDWSEWAQRLTDRHFGVGADGLLVVDTSERAEVRMREFNPDGSEAEMCGNGILCFTKYVLERGIVQLKNGSLSVETGAGVLSVEPHWRAGRVARSTVNMGEPELRWKEIPVNTYEASVRSDRLLDHDLVKRLGLGPEHIFFEGRLMMEGQQVRLDVTAVSMGNPHAVCFVEAPVADYPLAEVGPQVEYNMAFPSRVNYHVVNVQGPDRLDSRSWERGAGETLACGTGACAMVVAARLHGYVRDTVVVRVPGGELMVTWPGHGPVFLEGPAEEVFSGEWEG
jgi:diaminopimelate epimerase